VKNKKSEKLYRIEKEKKTEEKEANH